MHLLDRRFYLNELRMVIAYVRRPDPTVPEQRLWHHPSAFIALVLVSLVLAIIASIISQIIMAMSGAPPLENVLETSEMTPVEWLWMGVVLAPLIEESAYRAPLRLTPLMIAVFSAAWTTALLVLLFGGAIARADPGTALFYAFAPFVAGGVVAIGAYTFLSRGGFQEALLQVGTRWFPLMFWGSIVIFGLAHVSNYGGIILQEHWPYFPVLVLPQLVFGAVLGVVRMRFGFLASIFAHALYNGILLTVFG